MGSSKLSLKNFIRYISIYIMMKTCIYIYMFEILDIIHIHQWSKRNQFPSIKAYIFLFFLVKFLPNLLVLYIHIYYLIYQYYMQINYPNFQESLLFTSTLKQSQRIKDLTRVKGNMKHQKIYSNTVQRVLHEEQESQFCILGYLISLFSSSLVDPLPIKYQE